MQLKLELRDGKLRPVVLEREDRPKRNSYVETLQDCLKATGDIKETEITDGKFGKNTEAAVKKFQKANGLKETGRVDPETARKLDEKVAEKIISQTQAEEIEEYLGTDEEEEKDKKEQEKDKQKDDKQKQKEEKSQKR